MVQPIVSIVNLEARTMTCPRCEREQPMRDFTMLGMSPFYAALLTPIFRCGACSHLFAPKAGLLAPTET
jgi:C4-type Zn-finger protein